MAVGLLGLWPSDGWAYGRGLLRLWPPFVGLLGQSMPVGLLEARNGKWIWLKHYQAAKDIADIANQIEIFIATEDVKIATKHCNR